jgi:hypothetical protein
LLAGVGLCLSANDALAQAPPFPTLELVEIPDQLAYGDLVTVCGNTTGVTDGTAVTITITNTFMVGYTTITETRNVSTTVQGGVFCDVYPFAFYGPGSYSVTAVCVSLSDVESGSVAGPGP